MYTLDTHAIISYLDRGPAVVALLDRLLEHGDATFFVSTVTELELYSSPDLSDEEAAGIPRLRTEMFVVPLDSRLARSAGSLRRVYRLKTPDSAIAATALLTKTALLTHNSVEASAGASALFCHLSWRQTDSGNTRANSVKKGHATLCGDTVCALVLYLQRLRRDLRHIIWRESAMI